MEFYFFLIIFERNLVFKKTPFHHHIDNVRKQAGDISRPVFVFQTEHGALLLGSKRFEQLGEVADKHTHRNGQQDDAEQFTQHIDKRLAEDFLDQEGIAQHEVDDDDVQHQRDENIGQAIQGAQRQQGRERAGSGYERKDNRHQRCRPVGAVVAEYLHAKYHLDGHAKYHQRTGNGKGRDVDLEKLQNRISRKKEGHEGDQGINGGLGGGDFQSLVLVIDKDRQQAGHIDDGEEHDKGTDNLLQIEIK